MMIGHNGHLVIIYDMTISDERNPYTKNWLKNDETHISNLCFIFNIFRKGPI